MIVSNIKEVIGEWDAQKKEFASDIKATRDEMAKTALVIMKKKVSQRAASKGRGVNRKFLSPTAGAPPAKRTGTLFRSIKARKWNKADVYGAYVGLPKKTPGYYGKILEVGNYKTNKRPNLKHPWALPAFEQFAPLVDPIIEKNLGAIK